MTLCEGATSLPWVEFSNKMDKHHLWNGHNNPQSLERRAAQPAALEKPLPLARPWYLEENRQLSGRTHVAPECKGFFALSGPQWQWEPFSSSYKY